MKKFFKKENNSLNEIKKMLYKVKNDIDQYEVDISYTNKYFKKVTNDLKNIGLKINTRLIDENEKKIVGKID